MKLPEDDKAVFIHIRDTVEKACHGIDVERPDKALAEFGHKSMDGLAISMNASSLVRQLINIWTCAMLGVDSTDVSAIFFMHYCRAGGGLLQMRSDRSGGGQHLRFRGGSQTLCTSLRDCLKPESVVYSSAISSVEQSAEGGAVVRTRDGRQFSCNKVISTVPSPLLKTITFSPPLSADKSWLSTTSRLGFYAKVFLVYSKPWWREQGLCGLTQGLNGPVSLTRDTSSEKDGLFALACFIVGERGRTWAQQPKEERSQLVLDHVNRIYEQACPAPIHTEEHIWDENEEFSMGAPCPVVPAAQLSSMARDQWRPEGHIHFAGTETSTVWKGYMEGALRSGIRAAKEVIDELACESAVKLSVKL